MCIPQKAIREMIEKAGLTVVSIQTTKHHKARVRRADGTECIQVFSASPSDHRGMLNRQAALRRFARGT